MITVQSGHLVEDCSDCDGIGTVEVTPDSARPWHTERRQCEACGGSRYVPALCAYCGEPADCVDGGVPKCAQAYEEDHPGRKLPATAERKCA